MRRLRGLTIELVQTLLRVLPWPCPTGLLAIGSPGRSSPVLLTGNFRLTVERVMRALAGTDAWLLVANSRGVNVWCAATGGLLTDHDVVSVLKTSGIEARVDHRRIILPQLAATGIQERVVREKTGWRIEWGPVRAEALPAYLEGGRVTTRAMRTVRFPLRDRLEMALAWAFPISLLALLLLVPLWPAAALPVVGLVSGLSLLLFLCFPLYEHTLRPSGRNVGWVFFDFGRFGVPLVLWLLALLGIAAIAALDPRLSVAWAIRWGVVCSILVLVLGLDLTGSTPVYKSGLHDDRRLKIRLDLARCRGVGFCERVCPKNVFEMVRSRQQVTLARPGQCVQCGACIVQCPFDALDFEAPSGSSVTPESIRRFKLNLLGKRLVRAGESRGELPGPGAGT